MKCKNCGHALLQWEFTEVDDDGAIQVQIEYQHDFSLHTNGVDFCLYYKEDGAEYEVCGCSQPELSGD